MKKFLLILTISTILFSCKKENEKLKFIGNWSSTSDTNFNIDLQFFKDSIVHNNETLMNKESAKWKVIENKIYQTFEEKHSTKEVNVTLDYKFNFGKDTLYIKFENDSIYDGIFRKIKNSFEYLENKIGFELCLPKTSEKLTQIGNNDFVFNIYLNKKNDSLQIKTDEYFQNYGKLQYKISAYYLSKKEQEKDSLKFALFSDNSVNKYEIDSIKNILKNTSIKKIFRVYHNEQYFKNNWNTEINWLGKYEN